MWTAVITLKVDPSHKLAWPTLLARSLRMVPPSSAALTECKFIGVFGGRGWERRGLVMIFNSSVYNSRCLAQASWWRTPREAGVWGGTIQETCLTGLDDTVDSILPNEDKALGMRGVAAFDHNQEFSFSGLLTAFEGTLFHPRTPNGFGTTASSYRIELCKL